MLSAANAKSRSASTAMQLIVEVEPDGTSPILPGLGEPVAPEEANFEMDAEEAASLEGALGAMRERGRHLVAGILCQEDMVSADTLADQLHTTRATINSWRQKYQLLALLWQVEGTSLNRR